MPVLSLYYSHGHVHCLENTNRNVLFCIVCGCSWNEVQVIERMYDPRRDESSGVSILVLSYKFIPPSSVRLCSPMVAWSPSEDGAYMSTPRHGLVFMPIAQHPLYENEKAETNSLSKVTLLCSKPNFINPHLFFDPWISSALIGRVTPT